MVAQLVESFVMLLKVVDSNPNGDNFFFFFQFAFVACPGKSKQLHPYDLSFHPFSKNERERTNFIQSIG